MWKAFLGVCRFSIINRLNKKTFLFSPWVGIEHHNISFIPIWLMQKTCQPVKQYYFQIDYCHMRFYLRIDIFHFVHIAYSNNFSTKILYESIDDI